MRIVKRMGLVLVAICACSALAAMTASAHEFEASKTGLLLAKADGVQVFNFKDGTVECKKLTGHGFITTLKPKTQTATVSYTECSTAIGTVSEPINAEYEFSAENTVKILKTIKIGISFIGECNVTIPPQGPLDKVTYDNNTSAGDILLLAHVLSIKSSATGSICENYTNDTTGLYIGKALVQLDGGTIKWV